MNSGLNTFLTAFPPLAADDSGDVLGGQVVEMLMLVVLDRGPVFWLIHHDHRGAGASGRQHEQIAEAT